MRSKLLAMLLTTVALVIPVTIGTVSVEPDIEKYETIENYGFSPMDYEYEEVTVVENDADILAEPMVPEKELLTIQVLDPEPEYPLTTEEIELIALVVMAEAEGESELGKRLVIDTILNRVDSDYWYLPDTVTEVIYQEDQFTSMWNGRVDRCYVKEDIVELVKEELLNRTNNEVIFFRTKHYAKYGTPLFKEGNHYFSSL